MIINPATHRRAVVKRPWTSAGCSTWCEPSGLMVDMESRFGRLPMLADPGTRLWLVAGRREILGVLPDDERNEFDDFDRRHFLPPRFHAGAVVTGAVRRCSIVDQFEDIHRPRAIFPLAVSQRQSRQGILLAIVLT